MKKADHNTDRQQIRHFQQIINIGPASAQDFEVLIGRDPWKLYRKLCLVTKVHQDPCVLDVLMSAIDFMNGNPPRKWWEFTEARKEKYSARLAKLK